MNIPEENVIPTFLTVAAEETEPFEPKNSASSEERHKLARMGKSNA